MPVTFTFHKISEKKPEHQQEIVWMHPVNSFEYYGFEPKFCTVEFQWSEIDEDGFATGNAICYSEEDTDIPENHKLEILFDGYYAEDDWLWMDINDYQELLEK